MREPPKLFQLENIMTTETKPDNTIDTAETSTTENQAANNKAVFGPLGTYAVVAVIMVSIIVTTAITLNKELGSVDGKIVSIENEVAEFTSNDAGSAVPEPISTNTSDSTISSQKVVSATPAEVTPVQAPPVESAAAAEETETVAVTEVSTETVVADSAVPAAETENSYETDMKARQAQLASENKARIAAYKLEQKQHMSEMFVRIKELEAQQLDRYKSHQDTRVERLREQIAIQQKMIDTLISRNKELYDLRAANVQQQQTKREELINRI